MKMLLEILLLIILIIFFGYLFFHSADILLSPVTQQSNDNKVCFNDNCFIVELAKTTAEREKGLMQRTQLSENRGMLFIFDKEGVYPFWMKNTLIPLDIIWMDSGNRVVFIGENIQPCAGLICPVTNPSVKAKYVLEINANIVKKIGIKIGDRAEIKI